MIEPTKTTHDLCMAKIKLAKEICKYLRKHGIRAGVVRESGDTSPYNSDKYSAYIPVCYSEKDFNFSTTPMIHLSYDIDGKMGKKIEKILSPIKLEILYFWDKSEYSCFSFPVDVFTIDYEKRKK